MTTTDRAASAVLEAMQAAPQGTEWYRLGIAEETGLRSGSLYPALACLELQGLLESRFEGDEGWGREPDSTESVDSADAESTPRRRLYRLTSLGFSCTE